MVTLDNLEQVRRNPVGDAPPPQELELDLAQMVWAGERYLTDRSSPKILGVPNQMGG